MNVNVRAVALLITSLAVAACSSPEASLGESSAELGARTTSSSRIPWAYPTAVEVNAGEIGVPVTALCRYEDYVVQSPRTYSVGGNTQFVPFNESYCSERLRDPSPLSENHFNAGEPFGRPAEVSVVAAPNGKLSINFTFAEQTQPYLPGQQTAAPVLRALTAAQGGNVLLGSSDGDRHRDYAPRQFQFTDQRASASLWHETMTTGVRTGGDVYLEHSGTFYDLRPMGGPCPAQGLRLVCRVRLAVPDANDGS